MEYPFGLGNKKAESGLFAGLNPSFSGISFRTRTYQVIENDNGTGLNPSFSGISFRTIREKR